MSEKTKIFIIKNFICILLQIILNNNNKVFTSISERQHKFRGLIEPSIYFYNGIPKPIVWKIEIKCLHGCDNWLRFYIEATNDNVDKAGAFEIKLIAGKKKEGIGYKKISLIRVHIRSMDLLAGQFRKYTWENVTPQLDKVHIFQFGHFDQLSLDQNFYLNFIFVEQLPSIEMSVNGLLKFKKYVAMINGKSPVTEQVGLNMLSEIAQKFSEKELNEREYLGINEVKMELDEYFRRGALNFSSYLRTNEDPLLNFFVKQVPICGLCQGRKHGKDAIYKLKGCIDYFHKECINTHVATEHSNEPQNEQTKEFISKLKLCPICENIINLNEENEAVFDDEIKEKILYHIQLILPILQNGEYPHYTYHVGQARERKEYNRIEIISLPDEALDNDKSESSKTDESEVKRRKKGKEKLYKEDESLPEHHERRRTSRRLIDLFKDSPINKESLVNLVKLGKRIDRRQRRKEKEMRREEDKDKDEIRKAEEEEEETSLRKKSRKKQQSKEVVKNKDAKKEDDEEEGTPLRMRSRRKHIPGGEGHFADDKEVEDNEYHKNIALSLDQEHKQEEHMGDIRMARSPLRRQLSKERSQPTGARSLGVLQLPERSLSDQDIGSKPLFYETKHDGAKEGKRDSQGSDNLAMQLALFKASSKADEQEKDKGSTLREIPPFQHTEVSKEIEEIEEVSSDYSKIQNIQPWDWERFYQADSSSGQTSPIRKDYQQPSASHEIFEEDNDGEKEETKEGKVSSPKSPWFNDEDYIEDIEESNKSKKSSKSLKEKMTSKFRKLPKLSKIKRVISDKIERRFKST